MTVGTTSDAGPSRDSRRTSAVAVVVGIATLLQMAPRLWGSWGGWFFADDFWAQDLATRYTLWDAARLTAGGHFSPLTSVLSSAFTRLTFFDWPSHVAMAAVLWLMCDVVVLLVFREMWGWGWPTATAYAIYAISTFTVPSFLWSSQVWLGWSSVFALSLVLLTVVRALRVARWHRNLVAWVALVVALMLTERASVEAVCVGLFGLVAFTPAAGGLRAFVRRHWVLYLGSGVVLAAYAWLYLRVTGAASVDPLLAVRPSVDGIGPNIVEGFGQSIVPTLFGGPWFLDNGGVIARAEVPSLAVLVSIELLLVVLATVWILHRRGVRVLPLLFLVVVISLAIIAVARGSFGGPLAMRDWRYYANLSVWFPLILMTALVPPGDPASGPWPAAFPRRLVQSVVRHPVVWALVALVAVNGTVLTTYFTADRFRGTTSRPFLERTLADLDRLGTVVLVDRVLPDAVIPRILTTQTLASRVLSAAKPRPGFDRPTAALYAIADDGSVVPADVVGGTATRIGPDGSCGTAVQDGDTQRLRLAQPLFAWTWWARMDYLAQSDTVLRVKTAGRVLSVPVSRGAGKVYFPIVGAPSSIFVTAPPGHGGVCVGGVSVGLGGIRPPVG